MSETMSKTPLKPSTSDFLNSLGWGDARVTKLKQDASPRSYFRLTKSSHTGASSNEVPSTAVLVTSPQDAIIKFTNVCLLLRKNNLSAPSIYAVDNAACLMLLEDFGDESFSKLLENPKTNIPKIYELALDTLLELHRNIPPSTASKWLGAYDANAFSKEHNLMSRWCYRNLADTAKQDLDEILRELLANLKTPQCLVLRDYHVDNLMLLPNNRCGLLDFQDSLVGPIGYDLASLLDDVRYKVPPELKQTLMTRAAQGYGVSRAYLEDAVAVLSAQRLIKIFGIFHRLASEGKSHYLGYLDLCGELLAHRLTHPLLAPLRSWFNSHPLKGVNLTG